MKADSRVHVFNHHLYCPCEKRQGRTYLSELLKRLSLPSVVLRGRSLLQEAIHMGSPDMNQTKSLYVILTQCCPPVATDCPSLLLVYDRPPGCTKTVWGSVIPLGTLLTPSHASQLELQLPSVLLGSDFTQD